MTRARLAVLVALALSSLAPVARAHLGSTKFLRADVTPEGARLVADLDPIDVAYDLDLDEHTPDAILSRASDVRAWAERAFVVRSEGGRCTARSGDPSVVPSRGTGARREAVRIALVFECPEPRSGLVLHDGAFFDSDPQHESIVRIGDRASVLRAGRQNVELGDAPAGSTIATFLVEGALHFATGLDHVLFLVTLLLAAGALAAKKGTRRAARDVALVVTGFTLGHSVTLIAAALDVVTFPSQLVEMAIAGSIVLVAAWNIARPDARRPLPAVAFVFGLVHGFGFSSILRELVLPMGERVTALLAFNAGIEIAQLALVIVAIGPLAWAGRRRWYRPWVLQGGSALIGVVGLVWLVERALGG